MYQEEEETLSIFIKLAKQFPFAYAFARQDTSREQPKSNKKGIRDMNTKMTFLYRDASNYKQYNEFVVEGEITDEDIEKVIACLQDGEYFVPECVGIEAERFVEWTEDDHPFCELSAEDFELTDESPTEVLDGTEWRTITVGELVSRFETAADDGWTYVMM